MKHAVPALVAAALVAAASLAQATPSAPASPSEPAYWQVVLPTGVTAHDVDAAGFDVAASRPGHVQVLGDDAVAASLRKRGWRPTRLGDAYAPVTTRAAAADTYYGGYRTTANFERHLDTVAAQYPHLTSVVTLGPSYLKTVGQGGHDLRAICITKKNPGDCALTPHSVKPRAVVMAQIHAREISTGELATRWIDELTSTYGKDPAITQLVDTRELWVLPLANPDGLDKVVEGGDRPISQRKNMRRLDQDCRFEAYRQHGVDLNRNSSFMYKPEEGVRPCALTWAGTGPLSEPETQAIERWFRQLFPDLRDDDTTSTAKPGVRGTMITLHSYGDMVIYPFGFSDQPPPDAALPRIAAEMGKLNTYTVGSAATTIGYSTNGATDDFTYGALGVPSFTIELGNSGAAFACGGFFPVYSCWEEFWTLNRPVLMHAAQIADAPMNVRRVNR